MRALTPKSTPPASPPPIGARGGNPPAASACGRRVGVRRFPRRRVAGVDVAVGRSTAPGASARRAGGEAGADEAAAARVRACASSRRTRQPGQGYMPRILPGELGGGAGPVEFRRSRATASAPSVAWRFVLRRLDRPCRRPVRRARGASARAVGGEAVVQFAGRLQFADRQLDHGRAPRRRPSLGQADDRVAGRRSRREDRPVDRRGAAVLRQARGVQVDAAQPRVMRRRRRRSSGRTR